MYNFNIHNYNFRRLQVAMVNNLQRIVNIVVTKILISQQSNKGINIDLFEIIHLICVLRSINLEFGIILFKILFTTIYFF